MSDVIDLFSKKRDETIDNESDEGEFDFSEVLKANQLKKKREEEERQRRNKGVVRSHRLKKD